MTYADPQKNKEYHAIQSRKWYLKNKQITLNRSAEYRRVNPVKVRTWKSKANAIRRSKMIIVLTSEERAYRNQLANLCVTLHEMTGVKYHLDHIVPIMRGGLDHPVNWQVISEAENYAKGAKMTDQGIKLLPKLLEVYLDRLGVDAATNFADLHKEHFAKMESDMEFNDFLRSLEHD